MTRQHFERIAEVLQHRLATGERHSREGYVEEGGAEVNCVTDIAEALADEFAKVNPRFDRRRFLIACGLRFSEAGAMSTSDGLGAA